MTRQQPGEQRRELTAPARLAVFAAAAVVVMVLALVAGRAVGPLDVGRPVETTQHDTTHDTTHDTSHDTSHDTGHEGSHR